MIAEMMADMREEYERREERLRAEIARLTAERDDAIARASAPAPARRCVTCGAAVAFLALVVAVLLPTQVPRRDVECEAALTACRNDVQVMRESVAVSDTDEDYVCELEGEGGHDGD